MSAVDRKAAHSDRQEREQRLMGGLFKDARAIAGDVHERTLATNAGVVNEAAIQKRQAVRRAADAALLAESDESVLSVEAYRGILAAKPTGSLGTKLEARNRSLVELAKQKIYAPAAVVAAAVPKVNAALKSSRPILSARLLAGAGSSVPVVRPMLLKATGQAKA